MVLLSQSIEDIEQHFLSSLGFLKEGKIRECPVHILFNVTNELVVELGFKFVVLVGTLLLTIVKLSTEVPVTDVHEGARRTDYEEKLHLHFEYIEYGFVLYDLAVWTVVFSELLDQTHHLQQAVEVHEQHHFSQ